ncbi:LysR family transcriptional regulator [Phaeobacter sp.]|uniref:LysR family transcriptional regulator n=1 Tax=Phaeobacter sp. TaxID=1902409 RepID=UPI0025D19EB3|nr:LysR family transcriptional regulator [Phaeobacter sp.]
MTFEQLRTFLWVARLGGFRKASDRLHLSQPAVSTRIATLEDELDTKLFDRGPGGLLLTKQGQQLLGYAEQLLYVEEEIKHRVANPAETEGLFRIGASETIAQAWLPSFLQAFNVSYPRVNIDLTVDISMNLRAAILERQLDLAFLMGPVSEYSVKNVELPKFDIHWYKSKQLGAVDLSTIPIISYSKQTRPYRELTSELARRVGPKSRVFCSASLSASLKMIAAGIAVGPYPRVLAAHHLSADEIEEFSPGFMLPPLEFTASYLAEPRSVLVETGAEIARDIAQEWHQTQRC